MPSHYRTEDDAPVHATWECDIPGLPDVAIAYRPMAEPEWARRIREIEKSRKDPRKLLATSDDVIAQHVVEWDVRRPDGEPVPIEPKELKRLTPNLRLEISGMILDGSRAGEQLGNSSTGQGSASPTPSSTPATATTASPTS